MKKLILGGLAAAVALGLGASARADIAILDQIGPSAATVGSQAYASQYFEDAYSAYNVAAADDFTATGTLLDLTTVQVVIGGYNGYNSYTGITAWQVDIYGSVSAAAGNLIGNVFSANYTPAQVTADPTFSSATETLVTLPVNFKLPTAGTYYIAVIPTNAYGSNGQSAVFSSAKTTGGTNAFQVNPNGAFGFTGNEQTIDPPTDLAYRVFAVPEPSSWALIGLGTAGAGLLALRRRRMGA